MSETPEVISGAVTGAGVDDAVVGTRAMLAPTASAVHVHSKRRTVRVSVVGGDAPRSPATALVVFAFALAALVLIFRSSPHVA